MAILSEITELLRRWDVWKRVEAAPQRIDELERRVAALEARARSLPAVPAAKICPLCDGEMKVTKETPHGIFGEMGMKVHFMECTKCGNKVERDYVPGEGYK